jgi:serine/threonine protein kinase
MLVMFLMSMNLRRYLHQNQITWKEKITITYYIARALQRIHQEYITHRDLHSGNILLLQSTTRHYWYISDFGSCGPAYKPSKSIYGNLPYVAPEVLAGNKYTYESDIYSIGILMWEISSGQPPYKDIYEHNYDLAMRIVNGMRPKIVSGTPSEYVELMKQCWDADPLNRPDISTYYEKVKKMWKSSYDNNANEFNTIVEYETNSSSNSK